MDSALDQLISVRVGMVGEWRPGRRWESLLVRHLLEEVRWLMERGAYSAKAGRGAL